MANDKSGRKRLGKILTTIIAIIIVVVASVLGIDISNIIPDSTTAPTQQQATQSIQNVEGQLVVHMIDVGQAD